MFYSESNVTLFAPNFHLMSSILLCTSLASAWLVKLLANVLVHSFLPGLSNCVGQCASPQFPTVAGAFLFPVPLNCPMSCWVNPVLNSNCVILMTLLFFDLFWWFCDSCMQINALVTAKSKQNQNKYLYHFLDFLQIEYCILFWSAMSTPNITCCTNLRRLELTHSVAFHLFSFFVPPYFLLDHSWYLGM